MSGSTWNIPGPPYDLIVVGAGHAGIEAALASARLGLRTLMITMSLQTVGQMSCNPAIGGLGKGHLVRELDALGGEMARTIDRTGIQFRLLNRSKGPAVWSPRAQADKWLYAQEMATTLANCPGLHLRQGMVSDIRMDGGKIHSVVLSSGAEFRCHALVLCNGTFLNGLTHVGSKQEASGRAGEPPATGLSEALVRAGIEVRRFKTGTPPRVDRASIDFSAFEEQKGDEIPRPFRFYENLICQPPQSCWLAWTDDSTHRVLRDNLAHSPMFSGQIESTGPRYCPSVEDKVVRFADKERHQLFLEPESRFSSEMYVNGFSTSMPESVQLEALRTVPGFQNVRFTRPGYAIEYDYFPAWQINHRLQCKGIPNLFLAGQINGTSGYEEAACQGLIAAINAAHYLDNRPEGWLLTRDQAYMGVLVDDLVSKPAQEPYRMFTSRAEFRLLLRQDNADERLMPIGRQLGLLEETRFIELNRRQTLKQELLHWMRTTRVTPEALGLESLSSEKQTLEKMLKRPEQTLQQLVQHLRPELLADPAAEELLEQLEFDVKYEGYIGRQQKAVEQFRQHEDLRLPLDLDYSSLATLSTESRQRLQAARPLSLGQAARLSGVRASDVTALWIHLQKNGLLGSRVHPEEETQ
ncbi:MAG: tRNA uridine-5-carboxymethylaminomethyl(34) synthesis enzyme MnmG [Calditrichaeota bacterium]|nr:tRNA uridine-5-carboxymethylaminomethyl(34) synthesis enzyme MnmG [Calditrichota bacterium]